jgi:branched-chain amino acid transport system substrate-binding protein
LTVDSFVAGMEKINGYHDIFGSPTITFGPAKHQGASESFLLQVKGGKFVQVEPGTIGY